jgi:hypothetical protein
MPAATPKREAVRERMLETVCREGQLRRSSDVDRYEVDYSVVVHHALLHDRVDGQLAFVQHD